MNYFLFSWSLFVWLITTRLIQKLEKKYTSEEDCFFIIFLYIPFWMLRAVIEHIYKLFVAWKENEPKAVKVQTFKVLMVGMFHAMIFYIPLLLIIIL